MVSEIFQNEFMLLLRVYQFPLCNDQRCSELKIFDHSCHVSIFTSKVLNHLLDGFQMPPFNSIFKWSCLVVRILKVFLGIILVDQHLDNVDVTIYCSNFNSRPSLVTLFGSTWFVFMMLVTISLLPR